MILETYSLFKLRLVILKKNKQTNKQTNKNRIYLWTSGRKKEGGADIIKRFRHACIVRAYTNSTVFDILTTWKITIPSVRDCIRV